MFSAKRTAVTLTVVCIVALLNLVDADQLFAQCSMCRTALAGSIEGQRLQGGFNNAILFLLPFPYLVFGTLAAAIWLSRKKSQTETQSQ